MQLPTAADVLGVRRSTALRRTMAAALLTAAVSGAVVAQTRAVPSANPLQNLPQVQAPATGPKTHAQVHTGGANPQLAALLSAPITVHRVTITGAHAVPFAEVAALFTPLTGRTVTVGDVVAASDTIAAVYQKHGYALSFGFVPTQTFANGQVRIMVVEGHVNRVVVHGNAGNLTDKIRAIADRVTHETPLKQATFERTLQVLGMLPGVRISANVPAPTTTDGATELVLEVGRKRFDATAGVDFNHPGVQGLITVTENGLTRWGEQASFSTLAPAGPGNPHLYAFAGALPIGTDGWFVHANASRYEGNPDTTSSLPSYLTAYLRMDQFALNLSDPLLLNNHERVTVTGGLYATRFQQTYTNTITGARLIQSSGVRALDVKADGVSATDTRTRQWSVEIAHGLNALGANAGTTLEVNGRTVVALPTDPTFTRYDGSFAQSNTWGRYGTVVQATGQYSPNSLPTTEQISFGGPRFGLAYDPGSASGDSGWGASAEFNRRFDTSWPWVKQVTPYVVAQWARVYVNGAVGTPPVARLGTAGVGVRWSDQHHYTFDLTLAQPFGDKPLGATHRDPRVNFGFSYKFP